MKKILFLASLCMTANVYAHELHTFNQIKTAVLDGKSIHIIIDFAKCTSTTKATTVQAKYDVGIFKPDAFIINQYGQIATSLMHFTLNDPNFKTRPIYQFITYVINNDENVNLSAQVLDATNYSPLGDKESFDCKIDSGSKFYD